VKSLFTTVEPHLIDLNPDQPRNALHAMPRTREDILEERRQLKAKYGELFDSTAALLFRHDPVGINFEVNPDEYQSEAGSILPRLHGCQSADDVCRVVHEEFVRWFDAVTAGAPERYTQIASEIWQLWQVRRGAGQTEGA
jgi:hypothetical protein